MAPLAIPPPSRIDRAGTLGRQDHGLANTGGERAIIEGVAVRQYTHVGFIKGCDGRTSASFREKLYLRKGKRHWLSQYRNRYSLIDGYGTGEWPMHKLDLESIVVLEKPVKL